MAVGRQCKGKFSGLVVIKGKQGWGVTIHSVISFLLMLRLRNRFEIQGQWAGIVS